jgi:hypothetical protein
MTRSLHKRMSHSNILQFECKKLQSRRSFDITSLIGHEGAAKDLGRALAWCEWDRRAGRWPVTATLMHGTDADRPRRMRRHEIFAPVVYSQDEPPTAA